MRLRDAESRQCPRCAVALERGSAGDVQAAVCKACVGTLLERAALGSLLEVLAHQHYGTVSADANLPAVPDEHGVVDCPACDARMERYGYMGSRKVMIDGCSACDRIWLDADELVAMVRMYVQFDKRADTAARAGPLSDIVGVHMNAQAYAAMLLTKAGLLVLL